MMMVFKLIYRPDPFLYLHLICGSQAEQGSSGGRRWQVEAFAQDVPLPGFPILSWPEGTRTCWCL